MIQKIIPILKKASSYFGAGAKAAKIIAHICVVGLAATSLLISQILEMLEEEGEEPP